MPDYDFKSARLFVEASLASGTAVPLAQEQAHYLATVLRLRDGDEVLVFNGRDGEWRARLAAPKRRGGELTPIEQVRTQTAPGDLHYLFAPLKHARLDYMVQKAVEMGASRFVPVLTQHGQVNRINSARMRANAVEAAEQCGILTVAEVAEPVRLMDLIGAFEPERRLVFCDEDAEVSDPLEALRGVRAAAGERPPLAVLIGPEGGFAPQERDALLKLPRVTRVALGPRILRADTAAVAALALVQAVLGDWR
jgi:16S rRNA (uracil1498-N3)-methyltransferase